MAQKVMIDGTAREIDGGKTMRGGTAYKIDYGKALVDGTIRKIEFGKTVGSLPVGSIVKIRVNGKVYDFIIVHQGLPSNMYDSSCNGTWVLMKECYILKRWQQVNGTGYKNSTIHKYLNEEFLNLIDAVERKSIKHVKIPYVNGNGGAPIASGENGLLCYSFLLSGIEIGFTHAVHPYIPVDGHTLSYFIADMSNAAREKRKAKFQGKYITWWTRSVEKGNSNVLCGPYNPDFQFGSGNDGVRPAFVLSPDTAVDDNGSILG